MRVTRLIVVALAVVELSGCVKTSSAKPAISNTSTVSLETTAPVESKPKTTTTSTTSTTTQPPAPIEIEKTLAAIPGASAPSRLLVADTEVSLASGTAIPPLPAAPCGFQTGYSEPGVGLTLTGCEFESEDTAEQYLTSWKTAIADPAPTYKGAAATTAPVTSLADWTGRTIAIPSRGEYLSAETRTDLVRRFGTRVYTVTATSSAQPALDTVAPAEQSARAQEEFVAANSIDSSTPGLGRQDELARLSIRYLAPSWEELRTFGTQVGPIGLESYGTPNTSSLEPVETYQRRISTSATDANGYPVTLEASINVYTTVGAAQRASFYGDEQRCDAPPSPVIDSINAWTCPAYNGQIFVANAQNGRIRILLRVDSELGADPAIVARALQAWERRLESIGFPMGQGDIEPITTPARTAAPLPTDIFDSEMFDGALRLTGARSTIAEGKFTEVEGSYAAQFGRDTRVAVGATLGNLTDWYGNALPADEFAATNADSWTTVRTLEYEDTDSFTGSVSRSYQCNMTRLLPSGEVLQIQSDDYQIDGDPLDGATPCIDPTNPFVTSMWDRFQAFSLASFEADEQSAFVRSLAVGITQSNYFYDGGLGEYNPVVAKAAPDSPVGTVAEWRTVWKPRIGVQTEARPITSRVVNFSTPDEAAAFVQLLTGGAPLTPFIGADGVEGGSNGGLGLIVARRGKWVATYESPGRTDWSTGYDDTPRPIEDLANRLARNLRVTGLE